MGKFLALAFLATLGAAAAADGDTMCATLYTYLGDAARQNRMSGLYFDTAALRAQDAYLQRNPSEDRQRYAMMVLEGARAIRDDLARGSLSTQTVMSDATHCNSHYFPDWAAAGLVWPDDPWANQTATR